MEINYKSFLETKKTKIENIGKEISNEEIHPLLFPFQRDIVRWACKKGRCAVFLDTGLGKTFIQLEWARLLKKQTLIIAPLSVAKQTIREGRKINIEVNYIRSQEEKRETINITNYEMIDSFNSDWEAIILDESSILKSLSGITKKKLIDKFGKISLKLCCTATPAPNDFIELGNHTHFLDICSTQEMLAMFFINANKEHTYIHDGKIFTRKGSNKGGQEWRLKHHAEHRFFEWMSKWSVTMTKPSDLGYEDDKFNLPPLNINPIFTKFSYKPQGKLFFTHLSGLTGRANIRKESIASRIKILTDLILGIDFHEDCGINYQYEQKRIQQKLLSQKSGERTGQEIKTLLSNQTFNGQGKDESLSPKILRVAPGRMESENSGRKRQEKFGPEKEICGGPRVSGECEKISQIMECFATPKEKSSEAKKIWDHIGSFRETFKETEGSLCDLQDKGEWELQNISHSGSRSQAGNSTGTALFKLQPGHREIQGQYQIINQGHKISQWVIWCGLDDEQREIEKALRNLNLSFSSIFGSLSLDEKEKRLEGWLNGETDILVSKTKICGFGLNLQRANNMIFFGLSDSWEIYYQAIRREWRFGQDKPVNVYIILSDKEREILQNINRKEAQNIRLKTNMIALLKNYEKEELIGKEKYIEIYREEMIRGDNWVAMLGDSAVRMKELEDESVDLSVFSPPFADLFIYSNSDRDLGNCRNWEEFFKHYSFIAQEILRVTKVGRLSCVHTSDIPAMANRDGYIGLKDFPGEVIRLHEKLGWVFVGRAFIQKNPQALKNGTKVLTPDGWKSIDSLIVGDNVIGSDGKATEVVSIWRHESRQMYCVRLSDGVSVDCDAMHKWTVRPYGRKFNTSLEHQWITLTTAEIAAAIYAPDGNARYDIPRVKPVEFSNQSPLPIHPYVLGVLIGDGCISQRSTIEFMGEPEITQAVVERIGKDNYVLTRPYGSKGDVGRHTIISNGWHENPMLDRLRILGLQGLRAWEKIIPQTYMRATPDERMELLRGLLDTDGTCKKNGQAYFATVSEKLAKCVVEIVQSLGGLAGIKVEHPKYDYKGEILTGRDRYFVTVNIDTVPFRLSRKAKRWHQKRETMRRIVSIEPAGKSECTCITVANKDGLFVTEGYVLTHNSQAIRVKCKSLLFVQLNKDSSHSRPALVDQVLIFKKPGENLIPITPVKNMELDNEKWILWAHGIWTDIQETETLQYYHARAKDDEKHICPLQLGTIERCIKLYSNPGELILSPFMGIGSEIFMAVKLRRKGIGIELKESYFSEAVKNLQSIQNTLF